MRTQRSLVLTMVLGAAAVLSAGCARKEGAAPRAAEATTPKPAADQKIPITTSSDAARSEFLEGRNLVDNLRITDSIAHFQKAIELDPNFATAELALSGASPTGGEFFDHLNKAAALADKVSNGEKLLILVAQTGANGDIKGQKEDLDKLLAEFPNDERAQFAMGGYFFGQTDYPQAIEHYRKATEINPSFASAFNLLGYAYRQNVNYADAEKAFQRYIELIPKDPNPYDSYAELLLKMGRFDDAVAQYRKALAIDPNFLNAHQGIAMALLYQGKPDQALAELAEIGKKARTDGERRTGLFAANVVHIDSGQLAKALEDARAQYVLGEKTNDVGAMAFDKNLMGTILLEMGKPDQAKAEYEGAVKLVAGSTLSDDIKANARLVLHYNLARVAAAKKDFAGAQKEADEFRAGAAASKNPQQVKNAHELDGLLALAQKDYDKAIAELSQANQQNPQDLYRLCVAYEGKGDAGKAADYCKRAADFNVLPNVNLAWVRTKAKAGGGAKG